MVLLWCDTPIAILRSKRQASSEDCLNANQRPRSAPQPKHSLFAPRIGSSPSHWIIFQAPQRKVHALAASWRLQCISGPQSTVHEAGRREVSCAGQGDICRDRLPSEKTRPPSASLESHTCMRLACCLLRSASCQVLIRNLDRSRSYSYPSTTAISGQGCSYLRSSHYPNVPRAFMVIVDVGLIL